MKMHVLAAAGLLLLAGHLGAQEKKAEEYTPKTLEEKKSYLIGYNIGATFRNQLLEPDLAILLKGLTAGLGGEKSTISDEEVAKIMTAIQEEVASRHKKAGEEFLAKVAKDPEATKLKSGLLYKVMKKGTGKSPKADDNVSIHYRGTLINGIVFEETYTSGKPANLFVNELIKGFSEALQLMKEGDKWELFVPSELAYGARPPENIPPNAALVFELELVKVNGPAKPAP
jgi:FKBP-type peptidyl-prolyl cis-trans isomerase FklB